MGTRLTFGLGVNVNESLDSLVKKSVAAEDVGLKYLWIGDSPAQLYAPVAASAIASRTSRIRIGLGLMSVLLHSPRHIAAAMSTLFEAYGDRFDLCIGVGDLRQLKRVGVRAEMIGSLPSRVLEAKHLVESNLTDLGARVKIWLGAQGPRMLAIGKAFTGVLLNYSNPEMIRWAISELAPHRKDMPTIGAYSPSYVHINPRLEVLQLAKLSSAVVALGAPAAVLKRFGLYEKLRHPQELADKHPTIETFLAEVPDEIVKHFSITMKAENLPSHLAELSGLGVRHIVFGYPQGFSVETVRELAHALNLAA